MLDVVLEVARQKFGDFMKIVSILVVLDVVLEASSSLCSSKHASSFNPCCAGCSSGRL